MDEHLSLIEETKRLIARVDAMQQAAHDLRAELLRYGHALEEQLVALQEAMGGIDAAADAAATPSSPPPPAEAELPPEPDRPLDEPADVSPPPHPLPVETPAEAPSLDQPVSADTPAEAPRPVSVPRRPKPRPDRRQAVRREGPPVPLYVSFSDGDEPFKGWVHDCSQLGLGIMVDWALPVSSLLAVRPVNAPQQLHWVKVEVRHCHKNKDRWHLGCKFLQEVPPEDLELFEP